MQWVVSVLAVAALLGSCSGTPNSTEPIVVDGAKNAFSAAGKAARKSKLGASERPMIIKVRLVDDYGREAFAPVVTLSWSAADLEKVNWREMSDSKMANLAEVQIDGSYGVIAFAEWCADYDQLTPRLCRSERSRAEEEWAERAA